MPFLYKKRKQKTRRTDQIFFLNQEFNEWWMSHPFRSNINHIIYAYNRMKKSPLNAAQVHIISW